MKITSVETLRVGEHPNILWVKIHTDEGFIGLGETWFGATAVEADLHDRIAPLILGEDPSRIEFLSRKMRPYVGFCGTGAEVRGLSAVDVALWDIAGKSAGRPLWAILGGKTRDQIQVYNTCAGPRYISDSSAVKPENFGLKMIQGDLRYEDLIGFMESPEELASSLMEMGIYSMKIWPFDFASGAIDGNDISNYDLKKYISPFEKIRAAFGDKMRLKAELHGIWSLPAAKKISRALEPIGLDWIEDPIWMDRISDLRELSEYTATPLAGGETLGGLGQVRELIESGRISTPIVDVTWGGGITFARKAASVAEAAGRSIAFHDCSGPITLAVSTHLALVIPNVWEQEFTRGFYYGWYRELVDELPEMTNGFISTPSGNGHGISLVSGLEVREGAVNRVTKL